VVEIEIANSSGVAVDATAVVDEARKVLAGEGVTSGELGIAFVGADEMRALKAEHLGIDEATDVLSFPIDGREPLPDRLPRQPGDVVPCPAVTGEAWRPPAGHGLVQLPGSHHGAEMERREEAYA